jgi:DNA-binding PadR family transcriptional regulator
MRRMADTPLTPLAGALLGLLHDAPQSGYALRKLFLTTPIGHFSDSPGSIYPALRRLERDRLIAGTIENPRSLRPRQVFRVTPKGLERLKAWLSMPVTRETVDDDRAVFLLRFVFMPGTLGTAATVRFLADLEREMAASLGDLRRFYRAEAKRMPLAGRLGLRAGLEGSTAWLRWARLARRTLSRASTSASRRRA